MSENETTWFLQTSSTPRGPFSLQELIRLACSGEILGSSMISPTGNDPWQPATELPQLELEWSVTPETGDPLPPCHILALRKWVETEKVEPFWDITHLASGETYDVVGALCSALLEQNKVLETRLEALGPGSAAVEVEDTAVGDAVDNLFRSLELKTALLSDARRKLAAVTEERDRERDSHQEERNTLRSRMEDLEVHLEEMDEAMVSITRKYRDLNDRLIQLRSAAPDTPA